METIRRHPHARSAHPAQRRHMQCTSRVPTPADPDRCEKVPSAGGARHTRTFRIQSGQRATRSGRFSEPSVSYGADCDVFRRPRKGEAYCACGRVIIEKAEGERPMSLVWKLETPPVRLFRQFSALRGIQLEAQEVGRQMRNRASKRAGLTPQDLQPGSSIYGRAMSTAPPRSAVSRMALIQSL